MNLTKLSLSPNSSPPQPGWKLVHGQLVILTANPQHTRRFRKKMFASKKILLRNLTPPSSPRLLHPGIKPPSIFLQTCKAILGRGDLQPGQLVAPPPPIPHPVHPHSSHLVPPVHQYAPRSPWCKKWAGFFRSNFEKWETLRPSFHSLRPSFFYFWAQNWGPEYAHALFSTLRPSRFDFLPLK